MYIFCFKSVALRGISCLSLALPSACHALDTTQITTHNRIFKKVELPSFTITT